MSREIARDCAPQNCFRIARRKRSDLVQGLNELNVALWEQQHLDLWPLRHTSSFRLVPGKPPVDPTDPDFYENWQDLGSFPLLGFLSVKIILTRLFKTFGGALIPLV